jgi:hypothetical protein
MNKSTVRKIVFAPEGGKNSFRRWSYTNKTPWWRLEGRHIEEKCIRPLSKGPSKILA